jgi:hypothetical protein
MSKQIAFGQGPDQKTSLTRWVFQRDDLTYLQLRVVGLMASDVEDWRHTPQGIADRLAGTNSATNIRRALKALAEKGFVEYLPGTKGGGRGADWRLIIDLTEGVRDEPGDEPEGVHHEPGEGVQDGPGSGSTVNLVRGSTVNPRSTQQQFGSSVQPTADAAAASVSGKDSRVDQVMAGYDALLVEVPDPEPAEERSEEEQVEVRAQLAALGRRARGER